jgi:hypothetical protein
VLERLSGNLDVLARRRDWLGAGSRDLESLLLTLTILVVRHNIDGLLITHDASRGESAGIDYSAWERTLASRGGAQSANSG